MGQPRQRVQPDAHYNWLVWEQVSLMRQRDCGCSAHARSADIIGPIRAHTWTRKYGARSYCARMARRTLTHSSVDCTRTLCATGTRVWRALTSDCIAALTHADRQCTIAGIASRKCRVLRSRPHRLMDGPQNDAQYRILVALVINTVSLRARPWRERAAFAADAFKTHNQVACSEFVIKASMQAADRLGRAIARKLIETGVDTSVPPSEWRKRCVLTFV